MIPFPDPKHALPSGLLCVSEELTLELLWSAYRQGIFPWTDRPVGWFAPPARAVLLPAAATFPRNVRKLWRKARFEVTFDADFDQVIAGCRRAHAHEGEWLTPKFLAGYRALHRAGHAHSVELWQGGALVGGTYGVQVGPVFSAESMFGRVDNASRSALYALVQALPRLQIDLLDVQVLGEVTARLGAQNVPRARFLRRLRQGLEATGGEPVSWPRAPFGLLEGEAP